MLGIRSSPVICSSTTALQNSALYTIELRRSKPEVHLQDQVRGFIWTKITLRGYCIEASLLFWCSLDSFRFFGDGDDFNLFLGCGGGWEIIALKEWYHSWRLMRSPCSWAREYLHKQIKALILSPTLQLWWQEQIKLNKLSKIR